MCPEEYGDWCWLPRMKGCGVPELCGDESASFAPAVGGRLRGVAETLLRHEDARLGGDLTCELQQQIITFVVHWTPA